MITAPINKIINFSNVDGPGNRTAIFFQKCPFRCLYCHNPETINMCINCGECIATCPTNSLSIIDKKVIWNNDTCVNCDTCIKTCKHLASPKVKQYTVEEVLKVIIKNKPFIRGITVSGGECMNYPEFLTLLFKEVRKLGLTTYIDSNGAFDFSLYHELMSVTDYVMLDAKAYDNGFHKELTGNDNETVLKNLHYLLNENKLYEVRTVLMNNHQKDNINTVINVAKIIGDKCRYKLIKYRQFGVRDEGLKLLGNFTYKDEDLNEVIDALKDFKCNIVTI